MCGHAAQWGQLPADQAELGLQQAMVVVEVLGRLLFEPLCQGFLRFAVNRHRLVLPQRAGQRVEAVGQLPRRVFQQGVAGIVRQAFAMGTQRRQVVEQRVRQRQVAQAGFGVAAEVTGFQQHVGQGARQCRLGVMRVASRQAIGQVVMLAALVLMHDLAQVLAVAAEGRGHHLVEAPALPVRQDQKHRGGGDQAAEQGIDQSRPDQPVAIADLVEAEQHHQGDRRRGQGVAAAARGEEHHAGDHREQRLDQLAGEQAEQCPAGDQAENRARNALHQLDPCGAIAGLADEQRGQQHPEALFRLDGVQHHVAGDQRESHAQRMAEQQRSGCALQAYAADGVA